MSIVRQDALVMAFGALTQVPLTDSISVTSTEEDVRVSILKKTCSLRLGQRATMGPYTVRVFRCFAPGIPGNYECLALGEHATFEVAERCGTLLAVKGDPLTMTRWSSGTRR